jgi:hypothetical protein
VAASFAILEFADIAFPRLGLSDGAISVVLWIGIAGFPVVLFGAWAIEPRGSRYCSRFPVNLVRNHRNGSGSRRPAQLPSAHSVFSSNFSMKEGS